MPWKHLHSLQFIADNYFYVKSIQIDNHQERKPLHRARVFLITVCPVTLDGIALSLHGISKIASPTLL
jgi:hypothetical protein